MSSPVIPQPTAIERDGPFGLTILWSDGNRRRYSAERLRGACPCATCREKRAAEAPTRPGNSRQLPVLGPKETEPMRVIGMQPVGHYAYQINFSDQHNSGLFTFEHLLQLGVSDATT
jgi:DUF971 family protein